MKKYNFTSDFASMERSIHLFQTVCTYALKNPDKRVLVMDFCPRGILSHIFLSGLEQYEEFNQIVFDKSKRFETQTVYSLINYLDPPCSIHPIKVYDTNKKIPENIKILLNPCFYDESKLTGFTSKDDLDNRINKIREIEEKHLSKNFDICFINSTTSKNVLSTISYMFCDEVVLSFLDNYFASNELIKLVSKFSELKSIKFKNDPKNWILENKIKIHSILIRENYQLIKDENRIFGFDNFMNEIIQKHYDSRDYKEFVSLRDLIFRVHYIKNINIVSGGRGESIHTLKGLSSFMGYKRLKKNLIQLVMKEDDIEKMKLNLNEYVDKF